MIDQLWLILLGFAAGILGSMIGLGGGIIIVPVLTFLGFPPTTAASNSLFGALSNFEGIIKHFSDKLNVVVPILPIFELPIRKLSVTGLVNYVADFVEFKGYD